MAENIEVEHPAGVKDLSREQKLEAKKWALRQAFGDELFESLYEQAMGFFEANKKQVLKR